MPIPSRKDDAPNYHPLVRHVARGLRRRCAVPADAHLLVAVSAGADSVALLRALALLAPRRTFNLTLTVAHINHHLRGEQSNADALFVQTLANQLKLTCHISAVHLDADGKPGGAGTSGDRSSGGGTAGGGNLEAAARDARYDALTQIAQHCGASYIATAHHADDQLETLLMRFIRGASVAGLRGIAPARPLQHDHSSLGISLVRPMLTADRDTARAFLGVLGQRWREDASNTDTTRVRNRLRHEVIPIIKDIRNDLPTRAVHLADHFADLNDLVDDAAKRGRASFSAETPPPTQAPQEAAEADNAASLNHQSEIRNQKSPHLPASTIPRDEARNLNPLILIQTLRSALIRAGANPDALPGHAIRPVLDAIQDTEGGERTFTFANQTTIALTRDAIEVRPAVQAD